MTGEEAMASEGLKEFAHEMMDDFGPRAWIASMQNVYAAEQRGEYERARGWLEIAAFIDSKASKRESEKPPMLPGLFDWHSGQPNAGS